MNQLDCSTASEKNSENKWCSILFQNNPPQLLVSTIYAYVFQTMESSTRIVVGRRTTILVVTLLSTLGHGFHHQTTLLNRRQLSSRCFVATSHHQQEEAAKNYLPLYDLETEHDTNGSFRTSNNNNDLSIFDDITADPIFSQDDNDAYDIFYRTGRDDEADDVEYENFLRDQADILEEREDRLYVDSKGIKRQVETAFWSVWKIQRPPDRETMNSRSKNP